MAKVIFKNKYCTFRWWAIQEFNLSPIEALLINLIDGLSRRKDWCYASKASLAKSLNVTPQTIYNTINKLIKKGLLMKSEERFENYNTALLSPTQKWGDLIQKLSDPMYRDD